MYFHFRSSHRRCSLRKEFLKIRKKAHCRKTILSKKNSGTGVCFAVNFEKFLRTPFLQNTSGRLLLNDQWSLFLRNFIYFNHEHVIWKFKVMWTRFDEIRGCVKNGQKMTTISPTCFASWKTIPSSSDHFFFYFWHVKPAYEVSATEFYTLHYKYFTSYLTRGIKMVAFTSYNFSRKSIHLNYTKNSFSHVKIQLFKVLQSCWYLMTGRILAVQPSPKTWTIWGPELFLRI